MNNIVAIFNNVRTWNNKNAKLAFLAKAIIGSIILSISAQITVHTPIVPITAQTLALVLLSFTLGKYTALASVVLYIIEGAFGAPVFSNGGFGIAKLIGPTGGFILGFMPACFVMAHLKDRGALNSVSTTLFALVLGNGILYTFGLLHLSLYVPYESVLSVGFFPFILGDVIKITIAMIMTPIACRLFSKIR